MSDSPEIQPEDVESPTMDDFMRDVSAKLTALVCLSVQKKLFTQSEFLREYTKCARKVDEQMTATADQHQRALREQRLKNVRLIYNHLMERYTAEHPAADIDVYWHHSGSIRIRITDPDFEGMELIDRFDEVRRFLKQLLANTLQFVSMTVTVTPEERKAGLPPSLEFDKGKQGLIPLEA